jgi:hypothetical protein
VSQIVRAKPSGKPAAADGTRSPFDIEVAST